MELQRVRGFESKGFRDLEAIPSSLSFLLLRVSAIVSCLLGPERAEKIKIFAGDVVPRKKPDPAIYILAATTLGVEPSSCVVVEDSAIGLAAAKAAGMKCIVTKSGYTAEEDLVNADAVFDCIGDPPEEIFDLAFCRGLLEKQYVS
ncbi:CBBY-like protein [Camellia lanceoleosa]|uniref:CBBY-like protein n=1 Tax=Camellia lanceoleosa TaxID=1840588 RepID=A0ACC0GB36_9ERIC|nr:CBBY-like protein [Camellia lanceoleosa]